MKKFFSASKDLLGKRLGRGAILSAVGSYAASEYLKYNRRKWELMEPALANLNAYNLGRGAGVLVGGWLKSAYPEFSTDQYAEMITALVEKMDQEDELLEDRARSRFLAAKILFHLEGFRLKQCRYELFQDQARSLLRKKPEWKTISRREVFEGRPFEAEYLIGATHRMLLMLSKKDSPRLASYLKETLEKPGRDTTDYFARLLAMTFDVQDDKALLEVIGQWFEDYREFEIATSHKHEKWIGTGLGIAGGELPAMAGLEVFNRIYNVLRTRKK